MSDAVGETLRPRLFSEPLDSTYLDIDEKKRANLLAWRGQFSPQFVQAILESYTRPDDVVLDPFAGSGTVLIEAARLGYEAYGYEVNPAAQSLAQIYTLAGFDLKDRLGLLAHAEEKLEEEYPTGLPLFDAHCVHGDGEMLIDPLLRQISILERRELKILLEALVIQMDIEKRTFPVQKLWSTWSGLRSLVESLPLSTRPIAVALGDARHLPLKNGSVDFVLTSPPYINVFNYHHNYRTSVEVLGWNPLISAKSEIGANRKFRQNRFLTVIQYGIDMGLALTELTRVCHKSARIVFVVGRESNVHKTPFYNGKLLSRIANEVVGLKIVLTQERKFKNRFGDIIKEDILHFCPTDGEQVIAREAVERSREIGRETLKSATGRVPTERRIFLDEALERAGEVCPSPEFTPSLARE